MKDRPQVPDAAPVQGSTSTRERSEQQAEKRAQERQQQEQHEQVAAGRTRHLIIFRSFTHGLLDSAALGRYAAPSSASDAYLTSLFVPHQQTCVSQAEAVPEFAEQPEQDPMEAAMQQVAQPPSAPADADYEQRQERALSGARNSEGNAAELRRLMQQQQQSQQKPNFLQVCAIVAGAHHICLPWYENVDGCALVRASWM